MMNTFLSHDLTNDRVRDVKRSIDAEASRRAAVAPQNAASTPEPVGDIVRSVGVRRASVVTSMIAALGTIGRGLVIGVTRRNPA